jgi:hypothetical protein
MHKMRGSNVNSQISWRSSGGKSEKSMVESCKAGNYLEREINSKSGLMTKKISANGPIKNQPVSLV